MPLSSGEILKVNNITTEKGFYLWYDTSPEVVEINVHTKNKSNENRYLSVYNIWSFESKIIHSRHNGAAMYIEELPNGKRYYCNDGHPDDNFDDIVFRLEYA